MHSTFRPIYLFILVFGLFFTFIIVDHFLSNKIDILTHNKYMYTSNNLKEQINEAIKNKANSTLNIAISLSENSGYKEFLKNKKDFKIDLKNVSLKIKEHSNYKNVWVHLVDKNGISRYRSWSPKKNDDITSIRKEIPGLLKNPKISSVISVGIFDMTFKSIVPVFDENEFLGLIEIITKTNSIAKDFEEKELDLVILVDEKYKKQIKKPFTKDFIDNYYVANLNAKKELKEIIETDIKEFINIKEYKILDSYFVTTYTLKDIADSDMGYFIIFKNIKDIKLTDILEFEYFIKLIGILLVFFIITIFATIHFYNRSKYAVTLEKDVKKRTQELNDLTKRYHQIFQGSKAIKLILDPETQDIIDINDAAVKFYGYKRDYFLKLKAKDLTKQNKEELKLILKEILENKQNIFTLKHTLSNDEIRDVEIYASDIQISNKTYIYAIIRDITDSLKAKEELEKKQKLFYQQSKMASMGEMIENIAHQWRQPLSTITTAASGAKIKKEFGELDDKFFFDSIDLIVDAANYLSHTIDDFRDFFKQSKEKERFNALSVLNNAIKLSSLNNKDIELIINCTHIEVAGFKNELIQVFLNIFNNSKDVLANIKDKKKLIKIDVKEMNNYITFSILDNGGGIDEEKIEKIFEPYFTTKHQSQGTGIGLYMSEQIIDKHFGGEISAKNVNFKVEDKDYFGVNIQIKIPSNLNS
ncbi:MAG: ATP-binding protein [Arcobacter sp.]|uniref:ATP-binding protein n=1 Tax=Arcobacter sp. TaxID=1872629 RepID=UPI003AFF9C93